MMQQCTVELQVMNVGALRLCEGEGERARTKLLLRLKVSGQCQEADAYPSAHLMQFRPEPADAE